MVNLRGHKKAVQKLHRSFQFKSLLRNFTFFDKPSNQLCTRGSLFQNWLQKSFCQLCNANWPDAKGVLSKELGNSSTNKPISKVTLYGLLWNLGKCLRSVQQLLWAHNAHWFVRSSLSYKSHLSGAISWRGGWPVQPVLAARHLTSHWWSLTHRREALHFVGMKLK